MRKVIIFHSPLAENAPADELDVLDEAAFFEGGLRDLGYAVDIVPFPYNMLELQSLLNKLKPDFVVNLVETLFSNGQLVHIAPFLLQNFKVQYTGCPAGALYTTSDKVLAKKIMQANGIPTPAYYTYDLLKNSFNNSGSSFIVKSLWEHASFGMDENFKLLFDNKEELLQKMKETGNPNGYFAEAYIHGREFNISLVDGKNGPVMLPPAEIRFHYPEDKPRIVGYRAKWDENSFEFANTVRSFEMGQGDASLLNMLEQICIQCWNTFELKGYARVDFRVDAKGDIYVLEINANPCISPDSGFVAAASRAGISQTSLVKHIIENLSY